jgi:hypothetical protein
MRREGKKKALIFFPRIKIPYFYPSRGLSLMFSRGLP